jgi:long-chain fatty acid transport protein
MGLLVLLAAAPATWAQGVIIPSAGPINSSMAGASTAAPVDFGGSYWNPAILSGLEDQEFLLGSALLLPSIHLQSSIQAGAVGGVFPPTNRFGESRSDSGVASGLATGFSFRLADDSPLTIGLGVFGLVGGGVNFPGSLATPILTPRQPPNFFGVGPIFANMSILAITPMASLQLSDRLAVGLGPIITAGSVSFNPAFFAPGPKDASGLPTFPAATNARPYWGGGFQVGLLYELSENWNIGFSYKSPVWQERWHFNSSTPDLAPRRIGLQASFPEIFSWGIAYKGIPRTLIDLDLRYIDYANSELFGQKVVDGGLGWRSVFVAALGTQYQATDRMTLRAGYLYNTNPIPNPVTLFNVQAPGVITNTFTLGASYQLTDDITLSLAWMHGFRNSIEGPILQIPSSSVRLDAQLDTIWAGFNVKFGGPRRKGPSGAVNSEGAIAPPATTISSFVPTPSGSSASPSSGLPALSDTASAAQNASKGMATSAAAGPPPSTSPQSP